MAPTATMEVGQDGVAIITLANPPVNALHPNGTRLDCRRVNTCQLVQMWPYPVQHSLIDPDCPGKTKVCNFDGSLQYCPPYSTMPEKLTTGLMSRQL